jgi:hypothetical protein
LCENMVKFLLSWCAIIPLSSFLLPVSWVYRPPFQPATGYMLIRDLFHLHKEDIGLSSLPLKKKWCINYEKLVYTHDHMKKKTNYITESIETNIGPLHQLLILLLLLLLLLLMVKCRIYQFFLLHRSYN